MLKCKNIDCQQNQNEITLENSGYCFECAEQIAYLLDDGETDRDVIRYIVYSKGK